MRILLFSFFICLVGCAGSSKKQKSQEDTGVPLVHTLYNPEEIFIAKGGPFVLLDSILVGMESGYDPCFFILNPRNKDMVRYGTIGNGPGEFIDPFNIQFLSKTEFGVYDVSRREYIENHLIADSLSAYVTKNIRFSNSTFRAVRTKYNYYVGIGSYREGMFYLQNSEGKELLYQFENPWSDGDERSIPNEIRGMAYQGYIDTNPAGDKLVYGCKKGDIIYFYQITSDSLKEIKKIENEYVYYVPQQQGAGRGAAYKKENKIGCLSLYTTDNYIYYLTTSKTLEDIGRDKIGDEGDLLRVYDWSGNYLKTFKLDLPCTNICVDEKENRIWAIANHPDPVLVTFDLKGL